MVEQLELMEGLRVPPPKCYDGVAECLDHLAGNFPEILDGPEEDLVEDILHFAGFPDGIKYDDILKSIRIWRERNVANT